MHNLKIQDYELVTQGIYDLQNRIREEPQMLIPHIEQRILNLNKNTIILPDGSSVRMKEGRKALDECIQFLKNRKPIPPLKMVDRLAQVAMDHVIDIGQAGVCSHQGTDGSTLKIRIEKYGKWKHLLGESMSFGILDPMEIMLQLIIDDGFQGRGHRNNAFTQVYSVVGIAFGYHKSSGICGVIDYAGQFIESSIPNTISNDIVVKVPTPIQMDYFPTVSQFNQGTHSPPQNGAYMIVASPNEVKSSPNMSEHTQQKKAGVSKIANILSLDFDQISIKPRNSAKPQSTEESNSTVHIQNNTPTSQQQRKKNLRIPFIKEKEKEKESPVDKYIINQQYPDEAEFQTIITDYEQKYQILQNQGQVNQKVVQDLVSQEIKNLQNNSHRKQNSPPHHSQPFDPAQLINQHKPQTPKDLFDLSINHMGNSTFRLQTEQSNKPDECSERVQFQQNENILMESMINELVQSTQIYDDQNQNMDEENKEEGNIDEGNKEEGNKEEGNIEEGNVDEGLNKLIDSLFENLPQKFRETRVKINIQPEPNQNKTNEKTKIPVKTDKLLSKQPKKQISLIKNNSTDSNQKPRNGKQVIQASSSKKSESKVQVEAKKDFVEDIVKEREVTNASLIMEISKYLFPNEKLVGTHQKEKLLAQQESKIKNYYSNLKHSEKINSLEEILNSYKPMPQSDFLTLCEENYHLFAQGILDPTKTKFSKVILPTESLIPYLKSLGFVIGKEIANSLLTLMKQYNETNNTTLTFQAVLVCIYACQSLNPDPVELINSLNFFNLNDQLNSIGSILTSIGERVQQVQMDAFLREIEDKKFTIELAYRLLTLLPY